MKKVIVLSLALLLIVSLTGCGSQNANATENESVNENVSVSSEESISSDNSTEASEEETSDKSNYIPGNTFLNQYNFFQNKLVDPNTVWYIEKDSDYMENAQSVSSLKHLTFSSIKNSKNLEEEAARIQKLIETTGFQGDEGEYKVIHEILGGENNWIMEDPFAYSERDAKQIAFPINPDSTKIAVNAVNIGELNDPSGYDDLMTLMDEFNQGKLTWKEFKELVEDYLVMYVIYVEEEDRIYYTTDTIRVRCEFDKNDKPVFVSGIIYDPDKISN